MATRRHWLQLSIRTLLVLLTLICVILGLWIVPAERQRRTAAAIEALGGRVTYVNSQTRNERFPIALLRRLLPQAYVDEIEFVGFTNTQVTDAGLARLQGIDSLKWLFLDDTQVTDAGLAHLKKLTGLQVLWLYNTQVADAGLANLKGLAGLQSLSLENTQVRDAGLAELQGLTALQVLRLNNTQVTDTGMAHLKVERGAISLVRVIGRF